MFAIPILGHGNGRDTSVKALYKGDGSVGRTGGFYFYDGVFTCSEAMYGHACTMVTTGAEPTE
jgi:hypothetical protein